jgi:hypothetical protein
MNKKTHHKLLLPLAAIKSISLSTENPGDRYRRIRVAEQTKPKPNPPPISDLTPP